MVNAPAVDWPCCDRCGNVCPLGSSTCECGARLSLAPVPVVEPSPAAPYGCTCDGAGLCVACELAGYEGHAA